MAKQTGLIKLERTIHNICFYKRDGEWFACKVSSLTGQRVMTSPRFARTMINAGLMGVYAK